jgi:hypothetical protein
MTQLTLQWWLGTPCEPRCLTFRRIPEAWSQSPAAARIRRIVPSPTRYPRPSRLGDHDRAIASITDALRIHRELDDLGGEANSLASLGLSYHLLGDHARVA